MTTEAASAFDAEQYKETTRAQWQAAAAAWSRWEPTLKRWVGPVTETLLDLMGIQPGHAVLDVAAGSGSQTLLIASRVGPNGRVLATDIAPAILELAAENARVQGFGNVETRVMDGESLAVDEAAFDAVLCRLGLTYFPDQQRSLSGMKRALRPGGKVGAMVYSIPENNEFFSIPISIIRRRAGLPAPAPGQPGPFSLGNGRLEEAYAKAGFLDVESRTVAAPLKMTSAAECVQFEKESFGALHQMLAGLDQASKDAAWKEIEEQLRAHEDPNGFEVSGEVVIACATK